MKVVQAAKLINDVSKEIFGEEAIKTEDLSNIIDIGKQVFNVDAVENYTRKLIDHIGRMIFVDRPYAGRAPRVLMESWEFGSVLEKVHMELPEASENETWELEDGVSYDPNIFYQPKVDAKFFNSKVTFEVPISITDRQMKSAFSNATQMNAFISMIYTAIENSLTTKIDALIMRTINNMIGETVYDDYQSGDTFNTKSGVKAVNLLYKYNQKFTKELTAAQAITDPDFLKYAAYQILLYNDRIHNMTKLFNAGKTAKFTPRDKLNIVMLSEFARAADIYLQSDTFHDELTKLPDADVISFWQGSGVDFEFEATSKIDIKTSSNNNVSISGVLCAMFDRDALGVTNYDRRVTTNYNGKAEFWNEWHKTDAGYFNDLNENFVVFFVA